MAEAPADLMDRRVEITGPVDRKMVRKRPKRSTYLVRSGVHHGDRLLSALQAFISSSEPL